MPDQRALSPHRFADVLLLTLVAGSADALGYLNLGKVFTSNMTGNVVLIGIAVSEGRGTDTGRSLFAFLAFIAGNCLGAWICSRLEQKGTSRRAVNAAIGLEAALLLIYALLSSLMPLDRQLADCYALIALLGAGMGLQAAAVYRLGTPGVTTTAITGTLTTLFAGLMKSVGTASPPKPEYRGAGSLFGLQAVVVVVYCAGAAASGTLNLFAKPLAGFFPAIIVLVVLVIRSARS